MFTVATVLNALELGFIYALVAMALFLSFRVLNIADMTTDGAFTLGCAVSATAAVAGHPFLGLPLAMLAGAAAGFVTAFLQTRLAVPSILAGIITNTGLYTVNLAVMGFSSNVPMLKTVTIFTAAQGALGEGAPAKLHGRSGYHRWPSAPCSSRFWVPGWACPSAPPVITPTWCAPPQSTRPSPSRWGFASPTP